MAIRPHRLKGLLRPGMNMEGNPGAPETDPAILKGRTNDILAEMKEQEEAMTRRNNDLRVQDLIERARRTGRSII